MDDLLDRLSRRGILTITAYDRRFDVRLEVRHPRQTVDTADLFEACHLGAHHWRGDGDDLHQLLTTCEEQSRPRHRDIDELRWEIDYRRNTRTYGPPLPSWISWRGWRPGTGRWLRTFSHAHEWLGHHLAALEAEREHQARYAHHRRPQEAAR